MTGAGMNGDGEDRITANVFMMPATENAPDRVGIGSVECSCGTVRYLNITGSPQCSLVAWCPECIEVIPEGVQ